MKILLLGAEGQLGWQLQRSLAVLGPVQALYAVIALALAPWALRWCRAQLTPSAPAATSG